MNILKTIILWIITVASLVNYSLIIILPVYRAVIWDGAYWTSLVIGGAVMVYSIGSAIKRRSFWIGGKTYAKKP